MNVGCQIRNLGSQPDPITGVHNSQWVRCHRQYGCISSGVTPEIQGWWGVASNCTYSF